MVRFASKLAASRFALLIGIIGLIIGSSPFAGSAYAADPTPRSLKMSNNYAGTAGVSYEAKFLYPTNGTTIGSVEILFCDNTPIVDIPCTVPPGMDASAATLTSQSGVTGFTIGPGATNQIVLTRPPALIGSNITGQYSFANITNPDNPGPMFARIYTYASSDATGIPTDAGGLALYYVNNVAINAEVPPYLLFCVGENITGLDCQTATEPFSDLGDLTPQITSAAQHQIIVATNASNGYSMWVQGTTMTSGPNVINAMAGGPSQKGTSQFGINLRANSNPTVGQDATGPGFAAVAAGYNQANQFRFNTGDTIATASQPDDYRKYTVSYIVNIPSSQASGVYSTTLTYVCLANF